MARAGDPRVTLRLSPAERAVLDGAAESCGVETGSLVKEAALRSAAAVARDVAEGRLKLRRRSSTERPVAAPAGERPTPSAAKPVLDPGVARAIAFRRATGQL